MVVGRGRGLGHSERTSEQEASGRSFRGGEKRRNRADHCPPAVY